MIYFYAILAMLDFIAIILVINEDIFYEIEEKVFKIFWILILPFFGAIFVIIKLNRLHNHASSKSDSLHDTNNNARRYENIHSDGGIGGGE